MLKTAAMAKTLPLLSLSRLLTTTSITFSPKKVGVVLAGCGVYDGSEVHEAAACLSSITRCGGEPVIFSPQKLQVHVVDHQTGNTDESGSSRCVMSESARIARGAILPLSDLSPDKGLTALVFPGGFGAAKNLSDFAFKGADLTLDQDVDRVIKQFHDKGIPMAFCCIAPILAAKALSDKKVKLTLGRKGDESEWPYGGALDAASALGAQVVEKNVDEVCLDEDNKIVTTPAFMYNGKFHQIHDGVALMIQVLFKLAVK